jgi:hypothetical protein
VRRCVGGPVRRCVGGPVRRCVGGPVRRCVGGPVRRCVGGPVRRWAGASVRRWAGASVGGLRRWEIGDGRSEMGDGGSEIGDRRWEMGDERRGEAASRCVVSFALQSVTVLHLRQDFRTAAGRKPTANENKATLLQRVSAGHRRGAGLHESNRTRRWSKAESRPHRRR